MTEYVVLLPGDESRWARADTQTRKAVYARHEEFARLLADRGRALEVRAAVASSDPEVTG